MAEADKIRIEPLTVSNYPTWSVRMKMLLVFKDLWEGIEPGTDVKKSELAKALIGLNVSPEYALTVEDQPDAKTAWEYFKNLFKGKSNARILQLKRDLSSLRQKPGELVATYASRARDVFSELKALGESVKDDELAFNVLNGLRAEFETIRTILLASDQSLRLEAILPKLQQEENMRQLAGESQGEKETAVAYAAKQKGFKRGFPGKPGFGNFGQGFGNKGSPGNQGAQQKAQGFMHTTNQDKSGANSGCFYCGKPGHMKKDCRKRLADLQRKERGGENSSGPSVAFSAFDKEQRGIWVVDSGSTQHLTGNLEGMLEVRPLQPPEEIRVTGESTVKATHVGRVKLDCKVGNNSSTVFLENVRYVPGVGVNLFSVNRATAAGAETSFIGDTCRVKVNGDTKMMARLIQGLWVIEEKGTDYSFLAKHLESAEIWHRRFCHAGYENLARLAEGNLVKGMHVSAAKFREKVDTVCEPCVQGKQTRLPFSDSDSRSKQPCELVHMDVCGPMPVTSTGGSKYFCTFLDDYSKLSVAVPIARKSDVREVLKDVLGKWELKTGKRVITIRSDRGGEYIDGELKKDLRELHITHELTVPGTPQQNGDAERLNRVLLERTRAVLAESGLSQNLWAEALVTVNYARNRTPVSAHGRTPWEMFTGQVPTVSHMRVFGSTAYIHVPKEKRNKLDPVSAKGVFLGYEPQTKGYRVLRERDGVIVVTRDVTFDERTKHGAFNNNEFGVMEETERNPESTEPVGEPTNNGTDPDAERRRVVSETSPGEGKPESEGSVGATRLQPETPKDSPRRSTGRVRRKPIEWYKASSHFASGDGQECQEEGESLNSVWQSSAGAVGEDRESPCEIPARLPDVNTDETGHLIEPQTYEEALESPQSDLWRTAMDEEFKSLLENQTWELVECPLGVKPVPMKWVYKIKRNADGSVERFKARLVAKGFLQKQGVDFEEVYAPVSKQTTVRALLAVCAEKDLELEQLDVKTAFLNGHLEEEIYMQQAQGYEEGSPTVVCKLRRAIYGLRQAPRAWYLRLKEEMEKLGWTVSGADPALFTRREEGGVFYALVYVDDILMAGPKGSPVMERLKAELTEIFDIRDLGESSYFLGMEIERKRDEGTIKLSQKKLTGEILNRFGMSEAKGRSVPLSQGEKLTRDGEPLDTGEHPYRELIGSLLYLSVCTRPDIAYAVGALSRYMSAPTTDHWRAAMGILRYLADTRDLGIVFGKGGLIPEGYVDADYAGELDTRRSTTGYVFILAGGAISWSSRLQVTVAVSTVEAEYMGAASAVKEALWLKKLARDLGLEIGQICIKGDNQGALKLLKHSMSTQRSKHIDVMHHFARERVLRGEVSFEYCSTEHMAADFLTKAVSPAKFAKCRLMIGIA